MISRNAMHRVNWNGGEISMLNGKMSRRDFLKTAAAAAGVLLLPKDAEAKIARTHLAGAAALDTFPDAEFIGRNCSGGILNFRSRPSAEAPVIKIVYEDALFPIYRKVVGELKGNDLNQNKIMSTIAGGDESGES